MPKDNIDRAIKRGTGELGGAIPEEVAYEGYGPAGIAVMVKALTDNRNRTVSEVRNIFTKNGGNLGDTGGVAFLFEQNGLIKIDVGATDTDELELKFIEAGAEDIIKSDNVLEIYAKPQDLEKMRKLAEAENQKIISAEIVLEPKTLIKIEDESVAKKILNLMEQLEELDDVDTAYSNFDIPEEILNKINN